MNKEPNQITGPNAGGPRQFPIRTSLAARVGQFWRSAHLPFDAIIPARQRFPQSTYCVVHLRRGYELAVLYQFIIYFLTLFGEGTNAPNSRRNVENAGGEFPEG